MSCFYIETRAANRTRTISIIACTIALISTLLNIYLFFFRSNSSDELSPTTLLRRPSQFGGLSQINYSDPLLHDHFSNLSLTTFPTLIQPISGTEPERIFYVEANDPRRKFTKFGTISPEDRRLFISEEMKVRSFSLLC